MGVDKVPETPSPSLPLKEGVMRACVESRVGEGISGVGWVM